MSDKSYTIDIAADSIGYLVLAHGAGASSHSDFMCLITKLLTAQNISVIRFNFPYMTTMLQTGKRRPPDKIDKLAQFYQVLIASILEDCQIDKAKPFIIGGKSMGGRIAATVSAHAFVQGVVCLGYPFHPVGKPEKLRLEPLINSTKPVLIIQGENDPFGSVKEITDYHLNKNCVVHCLSQANHDLKPKKSSGFNHLQHLTSATQRIAEFISQQSTAL